MVNTEKQTDEISNFFREIFEKDNQGTAKEYPPSSLKKPVTEGKVIMASKKLRNGKSPGIDNMYAEYIKYAPGTTHQIITDVLRKSVETDDYQETLKESLLNLYQNLQRKPRRERKKRTI